MNDQDIDCLSNRSNRNVRSRKNQSNDQYQHSDG
jgi:hypothetical protein